MASWVSRQTRQRTASGSTPQIALLTMFASPFFSTRRTAAGQRNTPVSLRTTGSRPRKSRPSRLSWVVRSTAATAVSAAHPACSCVVDPRTGFPVLLLALTPIPSTPTTLDRLGENPTACRASNATQVDRSMLLRVAGGAAKHVGVSWVKREFRGDSEASAREGGSNACLRRSTNLIFTPVSASRLS